MFKKLNWTEESVKVLNEMMDIMKQSIISNAEIITIGDERNEVDITKVEFAIYKSIMCLNEINKAAIVKKVGIIDGCKIIDELQSHAINEVNQFIIEDIEKDYDQLPPSLKKMFDEIQKRMKDRNGEK